MFDPMVREAVESAWPDLGLADYVEMLPADLVVSLHDPDDVLTLLEQAAPDSRLLGVAVELMKVDLRSDYRARLLRVFTRFESWFAAQVDRAVVGVAGSRAPNVDDFPREQVAVAMRVSPRTAQRRVFVARERQGRLSLVGAALEAGDLLVGQADDAVVECAHLDTATAQRVCATVVPRAQRSGRAQFRRRLRNAVIAADPILAAGRHEHARSQRRVEVLPAEDGMADLYARLPAVDAELVFRALTIDARRALTPGSGPAGIDNARADALCQWAFTALDAPGARTVHGRPVEVRVTMNAATMLGLRDDPADLEGYGPIPASIARELLPDATLRRLLTDPANGALLDVGRRTYTPPRALIDFVTTRDDTCVLPGCTRPAVMCEVDHCQPWATGGSTCEHNLAPLCTRHHRMKHQANWTLEHTAAGMCWTTPTGVRYYLTRQPTDPGFDEPGFEHPGFDEPASDELASDEPASDELDCPDVDKPPPDYPDVAKPPRDEDSPASSPGSPGAQFALEPLAKPAGIRATSPASTPLSGLLPHERASQRVREPEAELPSEPPF